MKTIGQIKREIANFAGNGEPLTKKQLLIQKCSIINKEFFSEEGGLRDNRDWKSPKDLLSFLKDLGDEWMPIWQENEEDIPPQALKQLIRVLSYLLDETGEIPAPKSIAVSFPAEILHKYVSESIEEDKTAEGLEDILFDGINNDNISNIDRALNLGAPIDGGIGHWTVTPLVQAVWRYKNGRYGTDNLDIVRALLERGADPNKSCNCISEKYSYKTVEETPLQCALERNKPDLAELLLNNGADPDVTFKERYGDDEITSLINAVDEGDVERIKFLLSHWADPDTPSKKEGKTPLMFCVGWRSPKFAIARMLIKAGADVNKSDNEGKTALDYAVENGHEKIAHLLLDKGAIPTQELLEIADKKNKEIAQRIRDILSADTIVISLRDKNKR